MKCLVDSKRLLNSKPNKLVSLVKSEENTSFYCEIFILRTRFSLLINHGFIVTATVYIFVWRFRVTSCRAAMRTAT